LERIYIRFDIIQNEWIQLTHLKTRGNDKDRSESVIDENPNITWKAYITTVDDLLGTELMDFSKMIILFGEAFKQRIKNIKEYMNTESCK